MDYGVSHWLPEKNRLDYFIGIKTEDAAGDVSGTVHITIPRSYYAVFATPPATHFDFVNTIHRTWNYINSMWLMPNGYRRAAGYEFEAYVDSNSRTFSEKIYIPLIPENEYRS